MHWLLPRLRKRLALLDGVGGCRPQQLCLITGPPRSGTSALVKWLEQQEGVRAFNESRMLVAAHGMMREVHRFKKLDRSKDGATASAKRAVLAYYAEVTHYTNPPILIDKEPLEPIAFPDRDYSEFVASVRAIFPDIKLIFMIRDPVSTIWSMTQRKWGYSLQGEEPRAFTLEEHIENWRAGVDTMLAALKGGNAYVCQYGALTSEPDQETARIGHFLGVSNLSMFQPKLSDQSSFGPDELALIEAKTKSQVDALASAGFNKL